MQAKERGGCLLNSRMSSDMKCKRLICQRDAGSSSSISGDENQERGNWSGKLDFFLSCIGYAVGLGNIWRFPYLCYRNGGGAFLIPYLLFLLFCGIPLFFLEVSYGQFSSLSPITAWRLSPFFKGAGFGMVLISGIVCIYYNIIIAWTLYYLYMSFTSVLPWSTCDNPWNTPACTIRTRNNTDFFNNTDEAKTNFTNVTSVNAAAVNVSSSGFSYFNQTGLNDTLLNITKRTTPSEEFWQNYVLQLTNGIDNMGSMRWELFASLLISWAVVFLCLIRGVKSSGKVVYVTATFPYLVLIILLVRGVTLPGAIQGIKFYIIPKWEKLLTFQVWGDAAMQIFYSIGAAWGALITMASYNKFHNNCYRDSLIVPFLNSGTSIFAGFVIFSIIGFMAHETGSDLSDVVTQGPGLIFVVYPAAVARLPIAPLWAVLFFLMVFTVGLDSQFGMFETTISAFCDEYPQYLKNKKVLVTFSLVFIEFLLGIPCVMQGGIYVLQIMDWYSSTFSLMVISFVEAVVISWIYGVNQFYKDIALMIGYQPCFLWKVLWCFITPALIVFVFLSSTILHTPVTYGNYHYPAWAVGIGWILAMCSLVPFPAYMIRGIITQDGTIIERIKKAVMPSPEWGPALDEYREQYIAGLSGHLRKRIRYSISLPAEQNLMMQDHKPEHPA